MKLKKYIIAQPLADETLSSWMWRVNSTTPRPVLSHIRFSSPDGEIVTRDTLGIQGERFADRDLLVGNTFMEAIMQTFDISEPWLRKHFPGFTQPTVPCQFRRAFCSQCFMESYQQIGIPVSKVQWCYLTKPLCELHGVPLHDSSIMFIAHDDYTVQALVAYWDDPNFKKNCDLIRDAGRMKNALALKAQRRLHNVTKRASRSGESFKVQMFTLTLMRAMLMPALHHAYPKIAFDYWGGTHPYTKVGIYGDFYQEIYRSTCLARLYALYYSAIALGWVSTKQAHSTLHEGYFSPTSVDQIWSRLDKSPGLVRLILSELKLYETSFLSIAGLEIPSRIRDRYDA